MGAKLLFRQKNIYPNGDIVEMKIWRVPDSDDKPHGLKYSLVYIQNGKIILGFDNAEGKGDHKHNGKNTELYKFKTIRRLVDDFMKDIDAYKNQKKR